MLDLLKDSALMPSLYLLGLLCGVLAKRYVYDVLRNYVIQKLKPGIIQSYLEEMLGLNQKSVLPPVMIIPVKSQPAQVQQATPVVEPSLVEEIVQGVEAGIAQPVVDQQGQALPVVGQ